MSLVRIAPRSERTMGAGTGLVAYFDTNIFDNMLKRTAGILADVKRACFGQSSRVNSQS